MSDSDKKKDEETPEEVTSAGAAEASTEETASDENGPVNTDYTDKDLHLDTVKRFMIGSFAVTLAFFVLMLIVHSFYKRAFISERGEATPETRQIAQPGQALLQTQPLQDLDEYNAVEEERLNTTADAGEHAVIPIEAAKQLMIEQRGFPAREPRPETQASAQRQSGMGLSPMIADMDDEPEPPARAVTSRPSTTPPQTSRATRPESTPSATMTAARTEDPAMIAAGKAIWEANCVVCHSGKKGAIGPNIHHAYGTMRQLENGESILMDDWYVINSMNNPNEHIAKGYQPVMTSFKENLTDKQKEQVTAYLRSMGQPIPVEEPEPEPEPEMQAPAPVQRPAQRAPSMQQPAPTSPVPPRPEPRRQQPAPEPEPAADEPEPAEPPRGAIFV